MLEAVLSALRSLRAPLSLDEYDLHQQIAQVLTVNNFHFIHEVALMSRCRIDFLVGDIGIEVKRGRPNKTQLTKQAERYLLSEKLSAIILVSEQSFDMPSTIASKPCRTLSLRKLWGLTNTSGKSA